MEQLTRQLNMMAEQQNKIKLETERLKQQDQQQIDKLKQENAKLKQQVLAQESTNESST